MLGRIVKPRPPETLFAHQDDCRTSDAELQWDELGSGVWQRVCSCGSESWVTPPVPAARAGATLQAAQHPHGTLPDDVTACGAPAVLVFEDNMWKSRCNVCGTTTFEWEPTPEVSRQALKELDQQGARLAAELLAERAAGQVVGVAATAAYNRGQAVGQAAALSAYYRRRVG